MVILRVMAAKKNQQGGSERTRLGPGARTAIAVNTIFVLAESLSGVYVNLFLFQVGESLVTIGWYHLYQYVGLLLGFLIAGQWAEMRDRTVALRIGIVLEAAFFLLILTLGERASELVGPLGLILGIGAGFHWLGVHTLAFDLTTDDDRDRFHALATTWLSAVVMLAPFIAGILIARLPGLLGYRVVFGLSLALMAVALFGSFRLHVKPSDGVFSLRDALYGRANPRWYSLLWIETWIGVRDGVFVFLVGIVLFATTGSELVVGTFALVGGVITVVMSWVVGARVTPKTRWRPLTVGFFLTCASAVPLAVQLNALGVLLYTLIEAVFSPMYDIPFESLSHRVLEEDPNVRHMRVEYLVAREIPLNLGRLLGVVSFLVAAPYLEANLSVMALYVGVIGLAPIFTWRAHQRILTGERG